MEGLGLSLGMHSLGVDGEGELRGNRLTQVHVEKWPLKQCMYFITYFHYLRWQKRVCIRACLFICVHDNS